MDAPARAALGRGLLAYVGVAVVAVAVGARASWVLDTYAASDEPIPRLDRLVVFLADHSVVACLLGVLATIGAITARAAWRDGKLVEWSVASAWFFGLASLVAWRLDVASERAAFFGALSALFGGTSRPNVAAMLLAAIWVWAPAIYAGMTARALGLRLRTAR
jgi:hypothetical protein